MSTSGLTPAGSATYDSGTMYVGDGTWDSTSNTFLLPNLQGLNYPTLRYNGMGSRFADMPGYYSSVKAHGILAAIVFLFLVPTAIMVNRFMTSRPSLKIRIHIWAQILTVLLTTVVFALGFFQVGPERSLTNPHHGIGLALYVLILVQFIGGWWNYKRSQRKRPLYAPLRLVLHQWLGRIIALLGLAQIPLGLALYGSPLYLFILYALAAFVLVVLYFVLDYLRERRSIRRTRTRYRSESGAGSVRNERKSGGFGGLTRSALAGAGVGALASRLKGRRDNQDVDRQDGSFVDEEKDSSHDENTPRRGAKKSRFFGIFSRRKNRNDDDDEDDYSSEDNDRDGATEVTGDTLERVEEGRPMQRPPKSATQPLNHRRSQSYMSDDSFVSGSPSKTRRGHGARNAVLGLGALGAARGLFSFRKRRDRKEQRRIEQLRDQEIENERMQRANSRKYTGDAFPRRTQHRGSLTASSNASPAPLGNGMPPLMSAMNLPAMDSRQRIPGPPPPPPPPTFTGPPPAAYPNIPMQNNTVPPPPPIHDPLLSQNPSPVSRVFSPPSSRGQSADATAAGLAGTGAGLTAGEAIAMQRERNHRRNNSASTGVASPPVSVKLNMHPDGRHVTLRRLTEEEAAKERDRRSSRNRSGNRRRAGSAASALSGTDVSDRWRRAEARETEEQAALDRQQQLGSRVQFSQPASRSTLATPTPIPGPPPIPGSDIRRPGTGSISSPGPYPDTATEASTNYAENRRRRRAQRARATLGEGARGPGSVEFS